LQHITICTPIIEGVKKVLTGTGKEQSLEARPGSNSAPSVPPLLGYRVVSVFQVHIFIRSAFKLAHSECGFGSRNSGSN
jgi:hypothetical protein